MRNKIVVGGALVAVMAASIWGTASATTRWDCEDYASKCVTTTSTTSTTTSTTEVTTTTEATTTSTVPTTTVTSVPVTTTTEPPQASSTSIVLPPVEAPIPSSEGLEGAPVAFTG